MLNNKIVITASCMALAALALPSCSSQEVPAPGALRQQRAITLGQPFVGKQGLTRFAATGDIKAANITDNGMGLYAISYTNSYDDPATAADGGAKWVFDDNNDNTHDAQKTAYSPTSGTWIYEGGLRYWDEERTYDFAAIMPFDTEGFCNYSYVNGRWVVLNIPTVQVAEGKDGQKGVDLLLSEVTTTTAAESATSGVNLTMRHLLSRLTVYVANGKEQLKEIQVSKVQLYLPKAKHNSYGQAWHNDPDSPLAGTWTSDVVPHTDFDTEADAMAETSDYQAWDVDGNGNGEYVAVPYTSTISVANAEKMDYSLFIAPTPEEATMPVYAKIAYTEVDKADNKKNVTRFVRVKSLEKFRQGYQYNLLISLTDDMPITFAVESIKDWDLEDAYANVVREE